MSLEDVRLAILMEIAEAARVAIEPKLNWSEFIPIRDGLKKLDAVNEDIWHRNQERTGRHD